jgi:hypothetical protein
MSERTLRKTSLTSFFVWLSVVGRNPRRCPHSSHIVVVTVGAALPYGRPVEHGAIKQDSKRR